MRGSARAARIFAVLATFSLAFGACGDDEDGVAETAATETEAAALPTEYTGPFLQITAGAPEAPKLEGSLTASDGTGATITLDHQGMQPPEPRGSGRCGDQDFDVIYTLDATVPGTLTIDGRGAADLEATENTVVPQDPPPPLCDERSGDWTGTSGDLEGRSGTFRLVGEHSGGEMKSTLTLEE